jgi:hypothetical protein
MKKTGKGHLSIQMQQNAVGVTRLLHKSSFSSSSSSSSSSSLSLSLSLSHFFEATHALSQDNNDYVNHGETLVLSLT